MSPTAERKHLEINKVLGPEQQRSVVVGRHYLVARSGQPPCPATVLNKRTKHGSGEAYISFQGQDKRLDAWVSVDALGDEVGVAGPSRGVGIGTKAGYDAAVSGSAPGTQPSGRKRTLSAVSAVDETTDTSAVAAAGQSRIDPSPSAPSTPEREHAALTRVRNFEDTRFGEYLIKTWYYSPYPLPVTDTTAAAASQTGGAGIGGSSSSSGLGSSGATATGIPLGQENGGAQHARPGRKRKKSLANGAAVAAAATGGGGGGEDDYFSQAPRAGLARTASEMFTSVGRGGEGARGRIWVCDLCFKYFRARDVWDKHSSSCQLLQPPGRRVYQRGSYTIWEVDGASATLYCQNLSLFGKLFIDHKSVFFHVENFLFYVICDAATSRRDQVMAFFSKEKFSYDDYNLACIVTFPPFQNRGFGKLLIEFSYYLTRHPSTRPESLSPGTPERPLSDLGFKGYMAYWVSVVLRLCRRLLADAPPPPPNPSHPGSATQLSPRKPTTGRTLRARKSEVADTGELTVINGAELVKRPDPAHKGQYTLTTTLAALARACHLRTDDVALTLDELGLLQHRRRAVDRDLNHRRGIVAALTVENDDAAAQLAARQADDDDDDNEEGGGSEWRRIEVVITRDAVDDLCRQWRVRDHGVLDEQYVLL